MIAAILAASLLATKAESKAPGIAAAFVIEHQLFVLDASASSLRRIPLVGLTPEEADLSPDAKTAVVSGREQPGSPARLFLVNVQSATAQKLPIALEGDQAFPRFAEGGSAIVFTAPTGAGKDSAINHNQLEEFWLADGKLDHIATGERLCNFAPVGIGTNRIAYVSTSCFIDFELKTRTLGKEDVSVAALAGPRTEIAVSADTRKVIYTDLGSDGLSFYALTRGHKPKKLATMPASGGLKQPRFVGDSAVAFVNSKKMWLLNAETGLVAPLFDLAAAVGSGRSAEDPKLSATPEDGGI